MNQRALVKELMDFGDQPLEDRHHVFVPAGLPGWGATARGRARGRRSVLALEAFMDLTRLEEPLSLVKGNWIWALGVEPRKDSPPA